MSNTTPAPTDEEIMELARPFISRVGSHWENDDAIPDNGRIEDFARAVLAKWGAQPAASPALGWCTHCGEGVTDFCRSKCTNRECPIGLPRITRSASPAPVVAREQLTVDDLAQEIRRVDGAHSLGAGALAEALIPWLRARCLTSKEGDTKC